MGVRNKEVVDVIKTNVEVCCRVWVATGGSFSPTPSRPTLLHESLTYKVYNLYFLLILSGRDLSLLTLFFLWIHTLSLCFTFPL